MKARKIHSKPVPQRHQWFDPWKLAKGDNLKRLVDATLRFVDRHEGHTNARAKARRPLDETYHRKRIEAVVCNLAHAALLPPPTGRVAVQLGHKVRNRYDSPLLGKPFSPLLSMLWDLDFLDLRHSTMRGEVSSIAPSAWFTAKIAEHRIQLADFGRDDAEEVMVLTRKKRFPSTGEGADWVHRQLIDYTDTHLTRQYRDQVRNLNGFLRAANIDFLDDGVEPRVDPHERTLKRRFIVHGRLTPRFDQGGRLFGGFWQNLKSERRRRIRIDGEPVAVLDYGAMFTRLAYSQIGETPPEGDSYTIPGLEGYRSGVKAAMNIFLFDGGPRRSWPKETGVGARDDEVGLDDPVDQIKGWLPDGCGVLKTKQAIHHHHPALQLSLDVHGE
jgi:hypothetical protein